jgi:hypothetical protein
MKDFGINKGLVQQFNTSDKRGKFSFYGFRKMFWYYLNKLGVPFYDPCCPTASTATSISMEATPAPINSTATATADQVATGYITSTSAAATTITLPTATALATRLGALAGSRFEFIVDNVAGASLVTVALGAGITLGALIITGSNTLTVAAGTMGVFRIVFVSATVARLWRED